MALSDQIFGQTLRQAGSTAGQFGSTGTADIGKASEFFRTLLGGNRQAIQQQISPAANAARDAADAARREQEARGSARTGGTAAQSAQIEDEVRKQMDTLIAQQQAGAAQSLAGIGGTELQTMMDALNIGGGLAQKDIQAREQAHAQMLSALIGGAGSILGGAAYAGKLFGI